MSGQASLLLLLREGRRRLRLGPRAFSPRRRRLLLLLHGSGDRPGLRDRVLQVSGSGPGPARRGDEEGGGEAGGAADAGGGGCPHAPRGTHGGKWDDDDDDGLCWPHPAQQRPCKDKKIPGVGLGAFPNLSALEEQGPPAPRYGGAFGAAL